MSITSHIDKTKDLTIFTVTGVLSTDKVLPVIKAFYNGDPTKHVLWNLIDTSDVLLTSEEVKSIAHFRPRYDGKREPGKTALVAQNDILFGLSRMFGIRSDMEGAPYTIMVFRNNDEAYKWFDEP